jgi:hypothetical protein
MGWFYSRTPGTSRLFRAGGDHLAAPLTLAWLNHVKLFFNNNGVAARVTDICASYPEVNLAVWDAQVENTFR